MHPSSERCVIGVDVGGTKIATGVVRLPRGDVVTRRLQPTAPERGGQALLDDVIGLIRALQAEAKQKNHTLSAIGIGVAELVDRSGQIVSDSTIRWRAVPVAQVIQDATGLSVCLEADVRAAARAEAALGAGQGSDCFLYITIGTGISAALVLYGAPYVGAHGLSGTFASSPIVVPGDDDVREAAIPLEQFASGPALAARLSALRPGFEGTAADVLALAAGGDQLAGQIARSAGRASGAAIAHVVNVLDPELVVLGGGLGLAGGLYRDSLQQEMIRSIWADAHRDLPLVNAQLGRDAGWIGAGLAALA